MYLGIAFATLWEFVDLIFLLFSICYVKVHGHPINRKVDCVSGTCSIHMWCIFVVWQKVNIIRLTVFVSHKHTKS
jgi:hypothetical protein